MKRSVVFCVLVGALGCVPAPKQDYTLAQLGQLDSLKELMRVQAQAADPLFNKRKQSSYSVQELQTMAGTARRLLITSAAVRDRFATGKPARFSALASDLVTAVTELRGAAETREASRASAALESMRAACSACHRAFR
jgi:hypothetical protein